MSRLKSFASGNAADAATPPSQQLGITYSATSRSQKSGNSQSSQGISCWIRCILDSNTYQKKAIYVFVKSCYPFLGNSILHTAFQDEFGRNNPAHWNRRRWWNVHNQISLWILLNILRRHSTSSHLPNKIVTYSISLWESRNTTLIRISCQNCT